MIAENSKNRFLFFNLNAGVSGDMLIGSLVDLGVPLEYLRLNLEKLGIGVSIKSERVARGTYNCTLIIPVIPLAIEQKTYTWQEFNKLINVFKEDNILYHLIKSTLKLIQDSEIIVHKDKASQPHELGNIDTIFDLVSFYSAIKYLNVDTIYSSGLPFPEGNIKVFHGSVSSLAPVSLEIIQKLQIPLFGSKLNPNFECCTPTGIALMNTFNFKEISNSIILKKGFGAGQADTKEPSNCLSAFLMEVSSHGDQVENLSIIETNIDDMNPEIVGYLMEKLFNLDIKDAWYTNISMKKNRPAVKISVLVEKDLVSKIVNLLKEETTTMGIRIINTERIKFNKTNDVVQTKYGPVRINVKLSDENMEIGHYPEFEDCKKLAIMHNIPLKDVFDEVFLQSNNRPR